MMPLHPVPFEKKPTKKVDVGGRHKVFQFEIIFLLENFVTLRQAKMADKLKDFENHPRMKNKV